MSLENLKPEMVKAENDPGHICFDDEQLKDLRGYKNKCDLCQADLLDTRAALTACKNAGKPENSWWADPEIVIGGLAISLSFGVLIGVLVSD